MSAGSTRRPMESRNAHRLHRCALSQSGDSGTDDGSNKRKEDRTVVLSSGFCAPPSESGGDASFVIARLAQHVTAPPHRLDVVLAARRIGQLLAQLAYEHVDDLELRLVHAAVQMVEEHLLGQ